MDSQSLLQFAVAALIAGALLQLWLAVAGHRARSSAPEEDVAMLAREVKALRVVVTHRARNAVTGGSAVRPTARDGLGPDPHGARTSGAVPAADYRDAVSRIRHGAGVKELTAACGLSRGEAELLVRVYGDTAGARPAVSTSDVA